MYADLLIEIAGAIKKLDILEESIISEEKMNIAGLRSKQAVLISDVIQSLRYMEKILEEETQFAAFVRKREKPEKEKLVNTKVPAG
jgi:hypothetical protein